MWMDNGADELAVKVARMAARYEARFGIVANTCYVNPQMIAEEQVINGVTVIPSKRILKYHLWIGRERRQSEPASVHVRAVAEQPEQLRLGM
jgi:hypothetical protein